MRAPNGRPTFAALRAVGNSGVPELTTNPEITVDLVLIYDVPKTLEPLEAQLRGTGARRLGVLVRLQPRP